MVGLVATASPASAETPLSVSKVFTLDVIPAGGTTTLTFTIENPNDYDATGVDLIDNMPSGLIVSDPSGAARYV